MPRADTGRGDEDLRHAPPAQDDRKQTLPQGRQESRSRRITAPLSPDPGHAPRVPQSDDFFEDEESSESEEPEPLDDEPDESSDDEPDESADSAVPAGAFPVVTTGFL